MTFSRGEDVTCALVMAVLMSSSELQLLSLFEASKTRKETILCGGKGEVGEMVDLRGCFLEREVEPDV